MALDEYTITAKLDEESRAIMQQVADNLERIESLLTQTVVLFTASVNKVLKVEVTQREDAGIKNVGHTGPDLVNLAAPARAHQKTKPAYSDDNADQPGL